jgi:hypothetical protein
MAMRGLERRKSRGGSSTTIMILQKNKAARMESGSGERPHRRKREGGLGR